MYLKQVEITGFKSFADKTRLQFDPGMIAIVGPNGCGKSNVSDAIRWVLGEQRPTQLRCSHMADVVFNGTDSRKPLGMAEVSITFADCEKQLGTEFNEVTVTRRVFRSGEGQYFINKVPSRLKDVNRLFMGTGIGTTSYSVMAQGQIDAILSSKPEDRRAVFEEAAGITKFKADRKDALRKLDQTDQNMLRLADVIREVKRQIGSMQRQAGKAEQFQKLREEQRGLDIWLSKQRISELDVRIEKSGDAIAELDAKLAAHQEFAAEAEAASQRMHQQVREIEERAAALTEQAAQADNAFVRAQEVIKTNGERILEYKAWAERDSLEISATLSQIEQVRLQQESLKQKMVLTEKAKEEETVKLEEAQEIFNAHREELEQTRARLAKDRQAQMECERRAAEIQTKISEMDEHRREIVQKRDRLSAERAQAAETMAATERAGRDVKSRLDALRENEEICRVRFETLEDERTQSADELHRLQEAYGAMQAEAAAKQAQLDLLNDAKESSGDYAGGNKLLLDPSNPLEAQAGQVLGTLAEKIDAPPELRLAVEASLRAWLDAVVVKDASAAQELFAKLLAKGGQLAAKFVLAYSDPLPERPTLEGLPKLLDFLSVATDFREAANRLLGGVYLAESVSDIPAATNGAAIATKDGALFRDGCAELWMPDSAVSSPLARRMLLSETEAQLDTLQNNLDQSRRRLEELNARSSELSIQIRQTRGELDESRRRAAQAEGEHQAVLRDAERAKHRLESVEAELASVQEEAAGGDEERDALVAKLAELSTKRNELLAAAQEASSRLEVMEGVYGELSQKLTDCRIQLSSLTQQLSYAKSQDEVLETRAAELQRTVDGRSSGVDSYNESIAKLNRQIAELTASLEPLQAASEELHLKIGDARAERQAKQAEIEKADAELFERRRQMDTARDEKSKSELERQECAMKRQNIFEHVFGEWGLDARQLLEATDPAWRETGGTPPPRADVEKRVAKLAADIQALGPVNIVAIQEYKELEERYTFLKAQEEDLANAKSEVMNVIQEINTKSYEMFKQTFEQADKNFQQMFAQLFNGGEAKLQMLENKEDPLECGVQITARPPGKRPQNITLLSGGERTMTAVSLLFSIFMIKPAPFCILDELDAALDDSNIGRFVQALKGFLSHSQFLIITHNQHTISGSDMVYGVTQQEKGVSKILSLALKDFGKKNLATKAAVKDNDNN